MNASVSGLLEKSLTPRQFSKRLIFCQLFLCREADRGTGACGRRSSDAAFLLSSIFGQQDE
jgi:hypothetical protein